ncbi:MAG: C2H2-type zinc finger protein [Thermoplasmatota archaeon]
MVEEEYRCKACGKSFTTRKTFRKHIRENHR